MNAFKTPLLTLACAAFQLFGANAWALPSAFFYRQGTDRIGPHSFPGIPVGDKVQIFAALDSNDPIGSPTISVEAVQGGTTLTLDPTGPLFPFLDGYHTYYKFIDFDPSLTGAWEIIPTDSTGTGPSTFTNAFVEPEFLPLVKDIKVQGTSLGATVTWTLPNLAGFDVDGLHFSVIEAASGRHIWNYSGNLPPLQTTSFTVPPGVMQVGGDYVYRVGLVDVEGSDVEENVSLAYSQPFRFTALTTNGDFNLDGTVDAADYVVWRNGLGTIYNQNDYGVWRSHFGASLGPGSGAALLSAAPLSAAVPEPASFVLATLGAFGLTLYRRRTIP
jgi:PEP-CTERM motif-containing protein